MKKQVFAIAAVLVATAAHGGSHICSPCLCRRPVKATAHALAAQQLTQIRSIPAYVDLRIDSVYQLCDLSGRRTSTFEVKLVSRDGEAKGYMIVNTDHRELPVPAFTLEGPGLTEQFRAKLGQRDFRVVWVDPFYSVALDERGHILASVGPPPVFDRPGDSTGTSMSDAEWLKSLRSQRLQWRSRHRRNIAGEWGNFSRDAADASSDGPIPVFTPAESTYEISYAEGYEREPHFAQVDPYTGANTRRCPTGCGAVAWATLLAWHDFLWTPELLRGSQYTNCCSWGNPPELESNTYMDRVIVGLGQENYLHVHGSARGGTVDPDKMDGGFRYIYDELHNDFVGKAMGADDVQAVYDAIRIDQRPVVINIPCHYCVAAGFWYHLRGDVHYIVVNLGFGSSPDMLLSVDYLEKYWYVRRILPRTETTSPSFTSSYGPVLCTSPGSSGRCDNLWVFWLGDGGQIGYARGTDGQIPDLASKESLKVTAIYPPSVTSERNSDRIYLLYVDPQHVMHLMRWEGQSKGWVTLNFPTGIQTGVRPAILGQQGEWLTVAFSNNDYGVQVISTCADVQRSFAWPDHIGVTWSDRYWTQVDPLHTHSSLGMVAYQDHTVLIWIRGDYGGGLGGTPSYRLAKPDGSDCSYANGRLLHWSDGAPSPVVSNNTLFIAYRSAEGGRIVLEALAPRPPSVTQIRGQTIQHPASVSSDEIALLEETCISEPHLGFIELEQGKHPMPVVGWTSVVDENRLKLRLLSVDRPQATLDYTGKP